MLSTVAIAASVASPAVARLQPSLASKPRCAALRATRCRAASTSSVDVPKKAQSGMGVAVSFSINKQVHFGQQIVLVGSSEELGGWELAGALPLTWGEGHVWSATVALPADASFEYKFVVADPKGRPTWEGGENRSLTVDAAAATLSGAWERPLVPKAEAASDTGKNEKPLEAKLVATEPKPAEEAMPAEEVKPAKEAKPTSIAEAVANNIVSKAANVSAAGGLEQPAAKRMPAATSIIVKGKAADKNRARRTGKASVSKRK